MAKSRDLFAAAQPAAPAAAPARAPPLLDVARVLPTSSAIAALLLPLSFTKEAPGQRGNGPRAPST
jgi:hypothetical protein